MKKGLLFVGIFLVSLLFVLMIIFYPRLKIKKVVEVNYNEKYKDPGFKAYNLLQSFRKKVKVTGTVNTKKLGEYKIKYSYKYLFLNVKKTRIVKVVDKVKPKITLEYKDEEICKNKYKEYKYKAKDNCDGDLTKKVKVELKDNKLIYTVKDSSGNEAVLTKKIKIKTDNKPELTLKGNDTITLYIGREYNEPGYEAKDECDGDLTDKVQVSGKVDKDKEGTYEIKYAVLNSNEEKKEKTRKVVISKEPVGGEKVIYLTFDDGPGVYTERILDTLKKYNVKATFFVTNQFSGYQDLISREAKEGHAVAVHTYTHKYDVYYSVDAYVDDFNKMNEVIKNQTGSYTNVFRFPGGSSNVISKKYSVGVVSSIASTMEAKGYKYYDWNVDSGDASGAGASAIHSNVVNGLSNCNSCVVLMHDIKPTTAEALDSLLSDLTSRGYIFDVLTVDGPTIHHRINN